MLDRSEVGKRGYLDRDFRLVHLKDSLAQKIDYHYHEFDKLVIFLGGKVTYVVEGVTYFLKPWDIVLIQHNLIHRPIIHAEEPLDACLDKSREQGFHLLRTGEEGRLGYARFIQQLEEALRSEEFGARRMADTLCQQLLIQVNRDFLRANTAPAETDSYHLDPKMEEILRYIAANLEGDLSVDALAARFYMSRYYLMHRFKEITGYTVHQYTVQKRLLRAGELIREGVPVMKAAEQAGFPEYSTFLRAFQNTFHTSPKNFR